MKIAVIGTGYVGLVTGTCFAGSGNDVTCVDIDQEKVARLTRGEIPIYEPGLEEMVRENMAAERLRFTTDLKGAVAPAELVYLAVGTPQSDSGAANLSAMWAVVDGIAPVLRPEAIVVTKSTVPVGTCSKIFARLKEATGRDCDVASNPEFLKEGTAIEDFLRPDRVVVGVRREEVGDTLRELYKPFLRTEKPFLVMSPESAEMTKYVANALLSTKISFINEMANLCERMGGDINDVRRGIGHDSRIGFAFLFPGVGYGGSCFPKDVRALVQMAQEHGVEPRMLRSVDDVNESQKLVMVNKMAAHFGGKLAGKTIAVWGLAFKPRTDDIREAPALVLIDWLLSQGAAVRVHDPEAMENVRTRLGDKLTYCDKPMQTLDGVDALAIMTEWGDYQRPEFKEMLRRMRSAVVFDGRNLYEPRQMQRLGFVYHSIGRPAVCENSSGGKNGQIPCSRCGLVPCTLRRQPLSLTPFDEMPTLKISAVGEYDRRSAEQRLDGTKMYSQCWRLVLCAAIAGQMGLSSPALGQDVSIGGFIPFLGIGMTKQFDTFEAETTFFIADPRFSWSGPPLGPGALTFFDLALLDTGAATHILTPSAAGASGFSIVAEGLQGTNTQAIVGAGGEILLTINDPAGIYAAGLGPTERLSSGTSLVMNTSTLRGQSSVAVLSAPAGWNLPNIVGLPMAAQHAIVIRNDQPQIFQHTFSGASRTVRTPQVELVDLDTAGIESGIVRRANLLLRPSSGFISGPFYLQNLTVNEDLEIVGHDNPLSPTVVENGGLYVEVDLSHNGASEHNKEFLLDTGADLTVLSEYFAASLGLDVTSVEPDFFLEVEGAGGVSGGVPGFYLDQLKIDAVGGALVLEDVPVAVLNLPNPADPGNTIDAILGTHVFNGRNIAIDAIPAAHSSNGGPRLYISDPITLAHAWASTVASASWSTPANWNALDAPGNLWAATVANVSGSDQTAVVSANSTIYQLRVAAPSARMTVQINTGATLTTFGEARIDDGGRIDLAGGKLDAQVVNIHGGVLSGEGTIFVGSGMINGQVRNLDGRIEPGDPIGRLSITGDLSQQADGTLAIELGGLTAVTQHDQLAATRNAFLDGTLSVSLVNSFLPSVGNSFTILTATQVEGSFETEQLPAGFVWDVNYNVGNVVLSVVGLGLAGDYNRDGSVNAADYSVWRNNRNSTNPEADGDYSGTVDHDDYLVWKNQYGLSYGVGSASGQSNSVPEPGGAQLALIAAALWAVLRRRGLSLS